MVFEDFATEDFEINFTTRDYTGFVLHHLDFESQLIAIRHLLGVHKNEDENTRKEIKEIEEFAKTHHGIKNDRAVDEWVERLHSSVYQDAAHSMSAVGMLAPFIESFFHQAFLGIHNNFPISDSIHEAHARWNLPSKDEWNCHYVWNKNGKPKKDLVKGIIQLSEATGLIKYLPDDLEETLTVLFSYRNKMFHNGFEWPIEERKKFWNRKDQEGWPSKWLTVATIDGDPWCIYLSDLFIWHCMDVIEKVIESIGRFAEQKYKQAKK